jgi:heme exporter protein C
MPSAAVSFFHGLARPAQVMRLCRALAPWLLLLAFVALGFGLYHALLISPPDYLQGEAVRIMYLHVPAAILSSALYGAMTVLALISIIWRHSVADVCLRETACVGAIFTVITLITGSLWGKPMWGAYWVWDARLTSVAVLLCLYLSALVMATLSRNDRGRAATAWLVVVGSINLPIIRYSVEWWTTLHQPASLLRAGGNSIDPSMRMPLYVCLVGFSLLAMALVLMRSEAALLEQKLRRLQKKSMLAR